MSLSRQTMRAFLRYLFKTLKSVSFSSRRRNDVSKRDQGTASVLEADDPDMISSDILNSREDL